MSLAAVAGEPEGIVDHMLSRRHTRKALLNPVEQSERRGFRERRLGPAFHKTLRRIPLGKCDGIGERRAARDDCAIRVDVGAGVDQRVNCGNVVGTCGPVQRSLSVGSRTSSINVSAGRHEKRNRRDAVGIVAGPVCHHMEQRARHAAGPVVAEPHAGEAGMIVQ